MDAAAASSFATVKAVILGNGSAGKSSVCERLRQDGFSRVYKQTIGIDWHEKLLHIRDKLVTLQLHDIGGQSLASPMLSQYIAGAGIILLLYDITDEASFSDAKDWLAAAQRVLSDLAASRGSEAAVAPHIYLVGNKVDLPHLRKVSADDHAAFIAVNKLQGGFFVSARTGEGVFTAFFTAAAARCGMTLSDTEIEFTRKVLTAPVDATEDAARLPGADDIEREDMAAESRKAGAASGCCVVQ